MIGLRAVAVVSCLSLPIIAHAKDRDVDLARQYFKLGEKLYERGDYARALGQFQLSYSYSKLPDLLYNMARCYEALGQLEQAISHYRRYLKDRKQDNAIIRSRISNLKKRVEAARAAAATAATPQKKPPEQTTKSDQPPPSKEGTSPLKLGDDTRRPPVDPLDPGVPPQKKSRWMAITGWVLAGTGVVLLGVGGALGASAASKASDIEAAAAKGGQLWADQQSTYDSGETLQSAAIGTMVAGGVVAVAGAVLVVLDLTGGKKERPDASAKARIVPTLSANGAGINASFRF